MAGGLASEGCMSGIGPEGAAARGTSGPFWHFYTAWDATEEALLLFQVSPAGGSAVGYVRPRTDGVSGSSVVQTLALPGQEPVRILHRRAVPDPDTHEDRSFRWVDGEWEPTQSFVWRWRETTDFGPCV